MKLPQLPPTTIVLLADIRVNHKTMKNRTACMREKNYYEPHKNNSYHVFQFEMILVVVAAAALNCKFFVAVDII